MDVKIQKGFVVSMIINSLNNNNASGYLEILDRVRSSLGFESVLQDLRAAGLSFMDDAGIIDISALISTRHLLRANLDVTFNYAKVFQDNTGEIAKADIDFDYNTGKHTGTISVDTT